VVIPVFLLGCGGGKEADLVVVKGRLVDKGQPFALDANKVPLPKGAHGTPPGTSGSSALQVIFISGDTKEQFPASTNADAGTFEVLGYEGKGIKPGRYKIAVVGRIGISPDTPDYFKGLFTPEKTQILRDVKAGEEVVIDISKPQG